MICIVLEICDAVADCSSTAAAIAATTSSAVRIDSLIPRMLLTATPVCSWTSRICSEIFEATFSVCTGRFFSAATTANFWHFVRRATTAVDLNGDVVDLYDADDVIYRVSMRVTASSTSWTTARIVDVVSATRAEIS